MVKEQFYQTTDDIKYFKKRVFGFFIIEDPRYFVDLHIVDTNDLQPDLDDYYQNTLFEYANEVDVIQKFKGFYPIYFKMFSVFCNLESAYGDKLLLGYEIEGEEIPEWSKVLEELIINSKIEIIKPEKKV